MTVEKNYKKYFITIHSFAWTELELDPASCMIFGLISGLDCWNGTYSGLASMTNTSVPSIYRKIDSMVERDILSKRLIVLLGNRRRIILASNYTQTGERRDIFEIRALLDIAQEKIIDYYAKQGIKVEKVVS